VVTGNQDGRFVPGAENLSHLGADAIGIMIAIEEISGEEDELGVIFICQLEDDLQGVELFGSGGRLQMQIRGV
jgi:hypothetical protein